MKRFASAVLFFQIAVIIPTMGRAQTSQPTGADPSSKKPDDVLTLQPVIVTAERRKENAQRAALAMSVVTGDHLAAAGVTQPGNLANVVPGLEFISTGGPGNNIYIRGVGTQGANPFAENAIAFNVDGVYLGRPGDMNGYFYDLQRVEVLKGPQGTLYGLDATGGAINVITQKPLLDQFGGYLSAGYGSYDDRTTDGAINLPIRDSMALRLAGQVVDRGGYYSDGYDDDKTQSGRGEFLFEPSATFSSLLTINYNHMGGKGDASALAPQPSVPLAPTLDSRVSGAQPASLAALQAAFPAQFNSQVILPPQEDGHVRGDYWDVSERLEASTPVGTLTILPAYETASGSFLSYRPGFTGLQKQNDNQKSVEALLGSPDDQASFRYLLGGLYFDAHQNDATSFLQGLDTGQNNALNLGTLSDAAFADLTYAVSSDFRILGGVRYTHEEKTLDGLVQSTTRAAPNAAWSPISGDLSFDNVSWKGGVEYDVTRKSLLYATVTTGFKAGGFFAARSNNTYAPEKITAYTLGSKNLLFRGRLRLNDEVYYWDYRNQQVTYISGVETSPGVYANSGVTQNIGRERIYGSEISADYLLGSHDKIGGDIQYLESEYTSFKYAAFSASGAAPQLGCAYSPSAVVPKNAARFYDVDCSGKPAVNAPKWSATLSYSHVFPLPGNYALTGEIDSKIESSRYLGIEYVPQERQPSFTSSDVFLTVDSPSGKWSVTAWVNNIENGTQIVQAQMRPVVNVVYVGLSAPRTYGLRGTYRF